MLFFLQSQFHSCGNTLEIYEQWKINKVQNSYHKKGKVSAIFLFYDTLIDIIKLSM